MCARGDAGGIRRAARLSFPLSGNGLFRPLDSSAACSRRRSTTYIPVGEPALE